MICNCCHQNKATKHFSYSTGYRWAKHCRECCVWLTLFREAFGPTRDWQANRFASQQRIGQKRMEEHRTRPRGNPMTELYQAWGIGV